MLLFMLSPMTNKTISMIKACCGPNLNQTNYTNETLDEAMIHP